MGRNEVLGGRTVQFDACSPRWRGLGRVAVRRPGARARPCRRAHARPNPWNRPRLCRPGRPTPGSGPEHDLAASDLKRHPMHSSDGSAGDRLSSIVCERARGWKFSPKTPPTVGMIPSEDAYRLSVRPFRWCNPPPVRRSEHSRLLRGGFRSWSPATRPADVRSPAFVVLSASRCVALNLPPCPRLPLGRAP